MSISVIYHVSVKMPDDTPYKSAKYEQAVGEIVKDALSSGQNSYSEIEEWAEFHSRREAEVCEYQLKKLAEAIERGEFDEHDY